MCYVMLQYIVTICLLFDAPCPHENVSSVLAEAIATLFTAVYLQCPVHTQ